jgi:alkanesulfonate monooxygenase SsuD/methylene tetrahydromethanopterin reductase-like flavin-dependent oxidoreductase (luciferase family)
VQSGGPGEKQIRFGAAVNVIHLSHPVDVATRVATTANMVSPGRFVFGFGSGFPNPLFSEQHGLSHENRHERTMESLEFILRCFRETEPFDWNGEIWRARNVTVLPKPPPDMPIATATFTPATLELAGERGYLVLLAGRSDAMRRRAETYMDAAEAGGRPRALEKVVAAASIYVSDSVEDALVDVRDGMAWAFEFMRQRGLLKLMTDMVGLPESASVEDVLDSELFFVGDPETVYRKLERLYEHSGGWGTLLYRCGREWAPRDHIELSMRRFMTEVAPRLAELTTQAV